MTAWIDLGAALDPREAPGDWRQPAAEYPSGHGDYRAGLVRTLDDLENTVAELEARAVALRAEVAELTARRNAAPGSQHRSHHAREVVPLAEDERREMLTPTVWLDRERRLIGTGQRYESLSKHDYELLACLLARRGRAVSRAVVAKLFGWDVASPNTRHAVKRLRLKLDAVGAGHLLVTVPGKGLRLEAL